MISSKIEDLIKELENLNKIDNKENHYVNLHNCEAT